MYRDRETLSFELMDEVEEDPIENECYGPKGCDCDYCTAKAARDDDEEPEEEEGTYLTRFDQSLDDEDEDEEEAA